MIDINDPILIESLEDFRKRVIKNTARFPAVEFPSGMTLGNPLYCAMGLVTEAWEFYEEYRKASPTRSKDFWEDGADGIAYTLELGDCLWYALALCTAYKVKVPAILKEAQQDSCDAIEAHRGLMIVESSIALLDAHKKLWRDGTSNPRWDALFLHLRRTLYLILATFEDNIHCIEAMALVEDKLMARAQTIAMEKAPTLQR